MEERWKGKHKKEMEITEIKGNKRKQGKENKRTKNGYGKKRRKTQEQIEGQFMVVVLDTKR